MWTQRFDPEHDGGCCFIATGTAALIAGIAAATGGVAAAKIGSNSARDAATLQTNAANYGADKQSQATAEALAFQRQKAQQDWAAGQQTQKANYDQWRARQNAIAAFAGQYGLRNISIPDYQPGVDPRYDTSATPLPGSQTVPNAAGGPVGGSDPSAFIRQWQQTHSASEGIAPLAAALKAQGLGGDRFMYGATPSDNELVVGGQKFKVLGGENSPGAYWYQPGQNDSGPSRTAPSLGGLMIPALSQGLRPNTPIPTPYQANTLGAYLGGRK